jgi:phosphoribosyl 1,2-cyclic phosphodiesterase
MRVHVCGARGSSPAVGEPFLRYGGHTPCIAIAHDGAPAPTLVLDAGTGITQLPKLLPDGVFEGTLLLTHLHWDHFQGLPFCHAADHPDARVSLWLPAQEDGADAVAVLERAMSPPHFPITPRQLRGHWKFGSLDPGEHEFEGFTVLAREVPHKGGRTFGYRISDGHSTLVFIPDHCPTALGPGDDGFGAVHPAAVELADRADALIHDAQLLPSELGEAAFGHAVADYAVTLARAAGIGRVLLFHHKPNRSDEQLDELAARFAGEGGVEPAADGAILEL